MPRYRSSRKEPTTKLGRMMRDRRMTVSQVAQVVGVSDRMVHYWLSGQRPITAPCVYRLCMHFRCKPETIVERFTLKP